MILPFRPNQALSQNVRNSSFECGRFNVGGWVGEDIVYCEVVRWDYLNWKDKRMDGCYNIII